MTTRIYTDDSDARERAASVVSHGGVIAFRTDTFYGLGANPLDANALALINELKGREGKPILVLISDESHARRLITETRLFRTLAERYWPGPLTLVAPARVGLPEPLTAGTRSVGVRLPRDEDVRRIVAECGGALTATSANTTGRQPARTAAQAAAYFPSGLSLVVDGGEVRAEQPSTVLDVTGRAPRLIREGAITRAELEEMLRGLGLTLAGV